jgi:hypothetical protein
VAAGVVDQVGGQAFQQDRVPADRHGVQGVGDAQGVGLDVCVVAADRAVRTASARSTVSYCSMPRSLWARARQLTKIAAQGQIANDVEAAELLSGIAKPACYGVLSWLDEARAAVWRADEVQFVSAAPVSGEPPPADDLVTRVSTPAVTPVSRPRSRVCHVLCHNPSHMP